jgi:uncharacterized protein YdeI (BOF family)
MKQIISIGLLCGSLLTIPGIAIAQTTIRQTQDANSTVVSGEIIRISGDDFILDDGTGQLLVEAESRPLRQANLMEGEVVTVAGHFDENSLEAYRITRASGEEIYIFDD